MAGSVVFEAKKLIEDLVKTRFNKTLKVVKSMKDEKNLINSKNRKFISIITADGKFDNKPAGSDKYISENKRYESFLRGARIPLIEIRVYANNEEESDFILEEILRNLPIKWKLGRYEGSIDIISEHNSDWTTNLIDFHLQSAVCRFEMSIATDPIEIPTFGKSSVTPV